jgi:hypothetical protein
MVVQERPHEYRDEVARGVRTTDRERWLVGGELHKNQYNERPSVSGPS